MKRHLLAVLVLLHLVAVTTLALPGPSAPPKASLWSRPAAQRELQAWVDLGGRLGLELTRDQVASFFVWGGTWLFDTREGLSKPFRPYATYLGTNQGWRLFAFINRAPGRLAVDLDRGQGLEPLFLYGDDTLDWRRAQLEQERVRALLSGFSWGQDAKAWDRFSLWLARRAHEDFPEARTLRAQWWRRKTPSAQELRRGDPLPPLRPEQERTYDLQHLPPVPP